MARDWTKKDLTYLKRYGADKPLAELAERFEVEPSEVASQLSQLGIGAADQDQPQPEASNRRLGNEPLLETYQEGLQALHGGKRDKARELFTRVAEECDQPELAERARQYLAVLRDEAEAAEQDDPDPFTQAVYEKNQGNLDEALEIAQKGKRLDDERFLFLAASIHALAERRDEAAKLLGRAIEKNSKNRVYAYHDPDFASLKESEAHAKIFEVS